jgi:hypothetical protein
MPPGKFLKFEARKRYFLHFEHIISSSNLSQKVPILDEKITKNKQKHFNNYDTTFSTGTTSEYYHFTYFRSPFTVFVNNHLRRMPLRYISVGSYAFYCG